MSDEPEAPVVLEVESLPREQAGPFLLLGVDKDAGREAVEAAWALRVLWARRKLTTVPLDAINWSREQLNDADRRIAADAASLNIDTAAGDLARLLADFPEVAPTGEAPSWEPVPAPLPVPELPEAAVPDAEAVRRSLTVPEPPAELPAVDRLLRELAEEPIDPWGPPPT